MSRVNDGVYKSILNIMKVYNALVKATKLNINVGKQKYIASVLLTSAGRKFSARILLSGDRKAPVELAELVFDNADIFYKNTTFKNDPKMKKAFITAIENHAVKCFNNDWLYVPSYVNNNIDLNDYLGGFDKFADFLILNDDLNESINSLRPSLKYLKSFYNENGIRNIRSALVKLKKTDVLRSVSLYHGSALQSLYDKLDIDFNVVNRIISDDKCADINYRQKYMFFTSGKETTKTMKDGRKITVNPRKEFLCNYPILVRKDHTILKDIRDSLDNMEPLPKLHINDINGNPVALNKKKLKLIFQKDIKDETLLSNFTSTLISCDANLVPEINPDGTITDEMWSTIMSVMNSGESIGVDKEIWLKNMNGNFEKNFLEMSNAAYNKKKISFIGEPHDSEIMEIINTTELKKPPKNIEDRENVRFKIPFIISEVINMYLEDSSLSGRIPPIHLTKLKENFIDEFKKSYIPSYTDKELSAKIVYAKNIINLFAKKVVMPMAVYLSGGYDFSSITDKDEFYEDALKILSFTLNNINKTMRMNTYIENRILMFEHAGDNSSSMEKRRFLNKDNEVTHLIYQFKNAVRGSKAREKAGLGYDVEWFHFTPSVLITRDGIHIIPLLTDKELKEEGSIMHHCVGYGGFGKKSLAGKSKIFSIRDSNLNRISTAEIGIDISKQTVKLIQHFGENDRRDHPLIMKVEEELKKLISKINNNTFKINWQAICIENELNGEKRVPSVCENAGYFPETESHIREAMVPWMEYIGKEYRKMPIDEFRNMPSISKLIKSVKRKNS